MVINALTERGEEYNHAVDSIRKRESVSVWWWGGGEARKGVESERGHRMYGYYLKERVIRFLTRCQPHSHHRTNKHRHESMHITILLTSRTTHKSGEQAQSSHIHTHTTREILPQARNLSIMKCP